MRRWLAWTIACTWIGTTLAVVIADHTHPPTTARVLLTVREISFRTNAARLLGPSDEEQLLVSGLKSLQIQFNRPQVIRADALTVRTATIQVEGGPSASCTFYRTRSGGFNLGGPSIVTMAMPNGLEARSLSIKLHGSLTSQLTTRPGEAGLKPGFECSRVRVNGVPTENLVGGGAPEGGESIFLSTGTDAQLNFDFAQKSRIEDTQIPILGEIRFSHIDPGTSDEKTVLLKNKNEVSFEKVGQNIALNDTDLLVVAPGDEFYVGELDVADGIHLSMHGTVRDVRTGAGTNDLATVMPSSLDYLDNTKRIYGVIPSIVALIVGILEKMGLLPKK